MTARVRNDTDRCVAIAPRNAVTLVELLVVITVFGILIALLLPAVQAAREAARRPQCQNHIKQLSLAVLLHHEAHGRFPSGGWGARWTPHPDRGTGVQQPGGWGYSVLPYIEQQALHDLGAGGNEAAIEAANKTRLTTPLPLWHCPSRRRPMLYGTNSNNPATAQPYLADPTDRMVRNDYAINGGDYARGFTYGPSPAQVESGTATWPSRTLCTGLVFVRSEFAIAHVRDGASNTYLIGEKYVSPDNYATGMCSGDNQSPYHGDDRDSVRFTGSAGQPLPPRQDQGGADLSWNFGSAHSGGFNMSMCDGSVRTISYAINPTVHKNLGHRASAAVIPGDAF